MLSSTRLGVRFLFLILVLCGWGEARGQEEDELQYVQQVVDQFLIASEQTASFINQITDKAQALVSILSDDEAASQISQTNEIVFAAGFGEYFVHGASGLFGLPESLPLVMSTAGGSVNVEDLQVWEINLPDDPPAIHNPEAEAHAYVYTGRFGDGPEHVGYAFLSNLQGLGIVACAGQPGCVNILFAPLHLIDPSSAVTAAEVGEYMQLLDAGYFDTPGSLFDWLSSKVGRPELSLGSLGPSECMICIDAAIAQLVADLAAVEANLGPAITAAEQAIADAAMGFIEATVGGGVSGAVGGATGGAIVGAGAGGVGAVPGAILGGAAGWITGVIGGAVGWAFFGPDTEQLVADLEAARDAAQAARCAAMQKARDAILKCIHDHCPELEEPMRFQLDLALLTSGC